MVMTVSVFRAFLECPAKALATYKGKVLGDASIVPEWNDEGSEAMACGSLCDAIVTKQIMIDENSVVTMPILASWLASSYDDGNRSASWLLNKNGSFNAAAKTTIIAANKLLASKKAQALLSGSKYQVKLAAHIAGWDWEGTADIIKNSNGVLRITDLKHPASIKDDWIVQYGKNVKVPYEQVWAYWFQLAFYRYALTEGSVVVDGVHHSASDVFGEFNKIRNGLLVCTREKFSQRKYIQLPNMVDSFLLAVAGKPMDGSGLTKLEAIRHIVDGTIEAPKCGNCDYCKSTSDVDVVDIENEEEIPFPAIDDKFGLNMV